MDRDTWLVMIASRCFDRNALITVSIAAGSQRHVIPFRSPIDRRVWITDRSRLDRNARHHVLSAA
ncbi:MAG: hypothetical protein ACO34J_12885 [Prochlorothrix sp.]